MIIKPLFRWAGGKSRMIDRYAESLQLAKPTAFVDLFGGSGFMSVYFYKKYGVPVYINELNVDIFQIYNQIKVNYQCFINAVNDLESKYLKLDLAGRKQMYLDLRESYHDTYNQTGFDQKTPVLFFLMSTNFNGIWQAKASTGIYYTSFGNGDQTTQVYDRTAMSDFKSMIDHATISNLSYEQVTGFPAGALVFMDPPYINSFTRYDDRNKFDYQLQEQSSQYAVELMTDHDVIYCNKNHELFVDTFGVDRIVDYSVKYTSGATGKVDREIIATNIKPIGLTLFGI